MKILILGSTGLLGNMLTKYFDKKVTTIPYRWGESKFKESVLSSNCDYLINCIGAIPQRKNNFEVNYELPIWLDKNFRGKVIHPGTDCEMDDDEYGISKKKASDWIKENGTRTKIIKTSIIGFEEQTNASLMSWFLSNKDDEEVNGYSNHFWNGNTTYFWAKHAERMMKNWQMYNIETVLYSSECVTKYELLVSINEVFGRNIKINSFDAEKKINKCLHGQVKLPHIEYQLKEMREYYEDVHNLQFGIRKIL